MLTNSPLPSVQTSLHLEVRRSSDEDVRMISQEIGTHHQNVQDFRAKLLGVLSLVTAHSFVTPMLSDLGKARAWRKKTNNVCISYSVKSTYV